MLGFCVSFLCWFYVLVLCAFKHLLLLMFSLQLYCIITALAIQYHVPFFSLVALACSCSVSVLVLVFVFYVGFLC